MASRLEIVQGIEDKVESSEKGHTELRILDIRMEGGDLGVRIKGLSDLFRDLRVVSER